MVTHCLWFPISEKIRRVEKTTVHIRKRHTLDIVSNLTLFSSSPCAYCFWWVPSSDWSFWICIGTSIAMKSRRYNFLLLRIAASHMFLLDYFSFFPKSLRILLPWENSALSSRSVWKVLLRSNRVYYYNRSFRHRILQHHFL